MVVSGFHHDVKVIVHNTKCSLNVQGCNKYDKRFDHLNNRTVGLYFAEDVINKVVMKINEKVDISKLNDFLRNMATEGKKSATVSKQKAKPRSTCNVCSKDFKSLKTQTCMYCQEKVHESCIVETTSKCGLCMIYPGARQLEVDTASGDDVTLENLKKRHPSLSHVSCR